MNWLATIILPLQGIVTRQVIRPETYIHEVGDVYTWGRLRIYVGAETYIHKGDYVYT